MEMEMEMGMEVVVVIKFGTIAGELVEKRWKKERRNT